jgi:hypothetical protein
MLVDCMKKGFKREEQLAAYKLLIQSYLFEDKLEKADSTMLAFLKKYPEYQLSPTDHSSFVNLFNSFKVKPVIQIAFHIGTNMPFLTSVKSVTVSSEPGENDYSSSFLNLYASLEAKLKLTRRFEVNIEGGYSRSSFTNKEEFRASKNKYTETQNRIEIPVTTTFNIVNSSKFTPYLRAGMGAALDLSTSAKATDVPTDINNSNSRSGPDIDRKDSRIFIDLFGQAGAGLKFKTTRGYINLEVRSNFGLLNQTVRGGASAETLRWEYKYVDDDFNLNNLNITLGYTQIFYKPSKRK